MKTGNTFKMLRIASGIKQKDLAEKMKVSPSYISLIEKGEREPTLEYSRKFSRALDIPVSVLIYQAEEPSESLSPVLQEEQIRIKQALRDILARLLQVEDLEKTTIK